MSDNLDGAHFAQLMWDARADNTDAVLKGVDLYPSLINRLEGRCTLLRWACMNQNYEMVDGLLKRGATIQFPGDSWNALMDACNEGCVHIVRLLLDRGADPCSSTYRDADPFSSTEPRTALGLAADSGYYDVCELLLSEGANMLAPHKSGTAFTQYGIFNRHSPNQPSFEEIQEQIASLEAAWRNGPHPSQRWARRWPMMQVLVRNGYLPLAARRAQLAAAAFPPSAKIPPLDISTQDKRRAVLLSIIFGNGLLSQLIVSFL